MIRETNEIINVIKQREIRLEKMRNIETPTNPGVLERHKERLNNIKDYLEDIEYIRSVFFNLARPVVLANKKEYEKILKEPGTIIDFEGTYCQVALTEDDYDRYGMYVIYMPNISYTI